MRGGRGIGTRLSVGALLCGVLLSCDGSDPSVRSQLDVNRLPKAMFDGIWTLRGTVIDVPETSAAAYIGQSGTLTKIRWRIDEQWLLAYRADDPVVGPEQTPGVATEPVAAFPIRSHFDIARQRDTVTGQPGQVYVENTVNRPWFERAWIRVDWGASEIASEALAGSAGQSHRVAFYVQQHEAEDPAAMRLLDADSKPIDFDGPAALKEDEAASRAEQVAYFDLVGRFLLEPERIATRSDDGTETELPLCPLARYLGQTPSETQRCGPTEVAVRTAFSRVAPRNYQARPYDDLQLGKFGFFRSARLSRDARYGLTEPGRIQLANRHNIWRQAYRIDADGAFVRDAEGRRVPIPVAEREPRPLVFHLTAGFPCELVAPVREALAGWDRVLRRTVAVAKGLLQQTDGDLDADLAGISLEQVPQMVTLEPGPWKRRTEAPDWSCENLVAVDDRAAVPRVGDPRHNLLVWVPRREQRAALGHANTAVDAETGEIVSAAVFLYGGAIDRAAGRALEIVRALNGDGDDLHHPQLLREQVTRHPGAVEPVELEEAAVPQDADLAEAAARAARRVAWWREAGTGRGPAPELQRLGARVAPQLVDDELAAGLSSAGVAPHDALAWPSPELQSLERARRLRASRANIWLADLADDAVAGLAAELWQTHGASRDYDAIWRALRGAILRAVLDHELGHALGLRHNFAGSYDSVNYPNRYWALRAQNLEQRNPLELTGALTFDALYGQAELQQKQIEQRMPELQYASVMDRGARFSSASHGPGKYDAAAILFGYAGQVEVFDQPSAGARTVLRQRFSDCTPRFESLPNPGYTPWLEQWHYSSVWNLLGGAEGLTRRRFLPWGDLAAANAEARQGCEQLVAGGGSSGEFALQDLDRPLEVPYLFCAEEYLGQRLSCQSGDHGADPLEIERDAIGRYHAYYAFNNYRRERLDFDPLTVYHHSHQQYFVPLRQVYGGWLLQGAFAGLDDDTLFNYWAIATYRAFNDLVAVLTQPEYGAYRPGDGEQAGLWVLSHDDPARATADEVVIPPGPGRRWYSRFDLASGYHGAERVLEVGHYWDALAAWQVLVGDDLAAQNGDLPTGVPFGVVFEDELTRLIEAMVVDDWSGLAPRLSDGRLFTPAAASIALAGGQSLDPATGQPIQPTAGEPVRMEIQHSFKLRVLLGAMATASGGSLGFQLAERLRVLRLDLDDAPVPPPDRAIAVCEHPDDGRRYGALYAPEESPERWSAAMKLVDRCRRDAAALDEGTSQERLRAHVRLNDTMYWLDLLHRLYDAYRDRTADLEPPPAP